VNFNLAIHVFSLAVTEHRTCKSGLASAGEALSTNPHHPKLGLDFSLISEHGNNTNSFACPAALQPSVHWSTTLGTTTLTVLWQL